MTAKPLRLLDITRTVSRMGAGPATGIDRVEQAYIRYVSQSAHQAVFVTKLRTSYALLDKTGVLELLRNLNSPETWGRRHAIDVLRRRLSKDQQRAQSYIRRLAYKTIPLNEIISDLDAQNIEYINVGHSNLDEPFLKTLRQHNNTRSRVMIHDVIPLDYPQFTKSRITDVFNRKADAVARYADQIICNSRYTEDRVKTVFQKYGRVPPTIVAHLGIEPMKINRQPTTHPNFIILGTIEPRKNHGVVLDVWAHFHKTMPPSEIPHLHIIGKRGWENEAIFERLDSSHYMGETVFEHGSIDDDALQNHLSKATALIFPSFVEGFGLPALEALQAGVPVICSDIPAFREIMPPNTLFIPPSDLERWISEIKAMAELPHQKLSVDNLIEKGQYIPTWESHFGHVFGPQS